MTSRRAKLWSPALALLMAATVGLAALAAALAGTGLTAWTQVRAPGPTDVDTLAVAVTAPAGAVLALWLLAALLTSVVAALVPPDAWSTPVATAAATAARRVAPRLLRHAVAALLGVTVLAGPAGAATTPAAALVHPSAVDAAGPVAMGSFGAGAATAGAVAGVAPGRPSVDRTRVTPGAADLSAAWAPLPAAGDAPPGAASPPTTTLSVAAESVPGWLPAPPAPARTARPAADPRLVGSGQPRATLGGEARVVVRRGDTLWSIAARHLGPGAGDAQVAENWPHWFTANRDVIGADPDHLVPGQRLRPPSQVGGAHLRKASR